MREIVLTKDLLQLFEISLLCLTKLIGVVIRFVCNLNMKKLVFFYQSKADVFLTHRRGGEKKIKKKISNKK